MEYDFYFSQTQKDIQDAFMDVNKTFINGVEYTECVPHGQDITAHSSIKDYVFICTDKDYKIEIR